MDKTTEQQRARSVKRNLPMVLRDIGFSKGAGGSCVLVLDGHTCRVGLQKFRYQPAFRVIISFERRGSEDRDIAVEFSDAHTYRDSPSGRKFDFGIPWGDNAVERCLAEIRDYVANVAIQWFRAQSRAVARGG
jgi:hypothetical protein